MVLAYFLLDYSQALFRGVAENLLPGFLPSGLFYRLQFRCFIQIAQIHEKMLDNQLSVWIMS
jgi:hypothetical protein